MISVVDGFLCFNTQRELTQKTFLKFYDKLRLVFLLRKRLPKPKLLLTSSASILSSHYGGIDNPQKNLCAFYDEKNIIVLNAKAFCYPGSKSFIWSSDTEISIFDTYKYTIPVVYIYHELIHHIQFYLSPSLYKITSFIEAVADSMSYIITGKNVAKLYVQECVGLYFMCRDMMKMSLEEYYWFLVSAITTDDVSKYLLHNKYVIKDAAKYHDGGVKGLMHNIKDYYSEEYVDRFWRDIFKLHNIIYKEL